MAQMMASQLFVSFVKFVSHHCYLKCLLQTNDRTGSVTGPGPGRSTTGPDRHRFNFWTGFSPLFAFPPEIDRDLLALKLTIAAMRSCPRNGRYNGAQLLMHHGHVNFCEVK